VFLYSETSRKWSLFRRNTVFFRFVYVIIWLLFSTPAVQNRSENIFRNTVQHLYHMNINNWRIIVMRNTVSVENKEFGCKKKYRNIVKKNHYDNVSYGFRRDVHVNSNDITVNLLNEPLCLWPETETAKKPLENRKKNVSRVTGIRMGTEGGECTHSGRTCTDWFAIMG
jgi:hypothetical protein